MKVLVYIMIFSVIAVSCEEIYNTEQNKNSIQNHVKIDSGIILINEISAKAGVENEFGDKADYIELYNTSQETIVLEEGKWTISDNLSDDSKYFIPTVSIEPKGHIVIWCDGQDTRIDEVHANFKLSSKGESVSLYYEGKLMDQQIYDSIHPEKPFLVRSSDGSEKWGFVEKGTPAMENTNF